MKVSKLRILRKKKGFTQEQLADLIQVSPSLISKFETGVATPSLEVAFKLAKVLGATVEDLFSPEIIQDKMSSETKYTSPSRQG